MGRTNYGPKAYSLPQPVWIIATYDEDGTPDAMNAAWGGISGADQVTLCLTPSHKTCKNFAKTGAFTISMAEEQYAEACDYVGMVSADKVPDKFAKAGFTAVKSERVNAPIINELAVCMECKVISFDQDSCIMRGEIVNVNVDDRVLTDGKVDVSKIRPMAFDPFNNSYHVIGEKLGDAWNLGKSIS